MYPFGRVTLTIASCIEYKYPKPMSCSSFLISGVMVVLGVNVELNVSPSCKLALNSIAFLVNLASTTWEIPLEIVYLNELRVDRSNPFL